MSSEISNATSVVERFLTAVTNCDRDGIRARHADDVLMFDFPDTVRGIVAYDRTWDFFFDSQTGPITFRPSELETTAGDDVAFVTCKVRCEGTTGGEFDFRLTVGLERKGNDWIIVHEHHSLPTTEARYVMPEKHSALGVS